MTWGDHFLLNTNISSKVSGHAWCASDTPVLLTISGYMCDAPFDASVRYHFIRCLLGVFEWRSNTCWKSILGSQINLSCVCIQFWLYNLVFHFTDSTSNNKHHHQQDLSQNFGVSYMNPFFYHWALLKVNSLGTWSINLSFLVSSTEVCIGLHLALISPLTMIILLFPIGTLIALLRICEPSRSISSHFLLRRNNL